MSKSKSKNLTPEELVKIALIPKEEEAFSLPQNWVWTKVGYLSSILRGVFYDKNQVESVANENNCLILRGGNIQSGTIVDVIDNVYVPKEIIKQDQLLQKGDVVVVTSTGSKKVIGKAAVAQDDFENVSFGTFLSLIRPNEMINSGFFGLYFQTQWYRDMISSLSQGVNINNVRRDHIDSLPFPIPPLLEQKRIVDRVESLLEKVNQVKELINDIPSYVVHLRKNILYRALSGMLTAEWREKNTCIESREERLVKIKKKRISHVTKPVEKSRLEKGFQSILENSLDFPDNWLMMKAEYFCVGITKGTTPPSSGFTDAVEIPFLKVHHIVNNKIQFSSNPSYVSREIHNGTLSRSKVYPRDVLMNIVGPPLGKVAIVPDDFPEWNINQAIAIFRPIDEVLPEYVYFALSSEKTLAEILEDTKGVVGQANISLEQCRELEMPVPPLEEQYEIVRRVSKLLGYISQIEDLYIHVKDNLEDNIQSILTKAFRGELGTNDPEEESALELLKEVLSQ